MDQLMGRPLSMKPADSGDFCNKGCTSLSHGEEVHPCLVARVGWKPHTPTYLAPSNFNQNILHVGGRKRGGRETSGLVSLLVNIKLNRE